MRRQILMLTTSAVVFTCGAVAAIAQQGPGGPMMQGPGGPMMQNREQQQAPQQQQNVSPRQQPGRYPRWSRDDDDDDDDDTYGRMMGSGYGWGRHHRGGMGPGMMGGMMGRGGMFGMGGMNPHMMRMVIILMDSDGDGALSWEEFRTGHERIFKAIDANRDGRVTLEEMQAFRQGPAGSSVPQPQQR